MRNAKLNGCDGVLRYAMPIGKNEATAIRNKFNSVKRSDRPGRVKLARVSLCVPPLAACTRGKHHTRP